MSKIYVTVTEWMNSTKDEKHDSEFKSLSTKHNYRFSVQWTVSRSHPY